MGVTTRDVDCGLGSYDLSIGAVRTMYSHTQNENGSLNSRCLDCLLTIASCVETERELERIEAAHACPEKVLGELLRQEREHGARPAA